jgi:GMP synthase (glutamine-hydrolysing)
VVHQASSDPGRVGTLLQQAGYQLEIRCPAAGDILPSPRANKMPVVVFGGPMSANNTETLPFIRTELDWIAGVLESGNPFLGICLGAQLLARVLGAKVGPHPAGMTEIGYFPIQPTSSGGFDLPRYVYHWHREGIELPTGAQLLGEGQTFQVQAFRYGQTAYGFQFHPEVTQTIIQRWTTNAPEMLTLAGAQSRCEQLHKHFKHGEEGKQWLKKFLQHWLMANGS